MENLNSVPNPKLRFDDPVKGLLSSVKIITIKPTSAPSAGQACSASDAITFKLPSAGIGKMGSMYLQYDIITNSAGTDTTGGIAPIGAVLDEHAPDASIFNRMRVHSSDGTMVSDTANYGTYCSVMNRLKNNRDESSSRGSIVRGEGLALFESGDNTGTKLNQFNMTHLTDGGNAVSANELAVRFGDGAGRNYRLQSQQRNAEVFGVVSGVGTTICHRIQSGLCDAEVGHMLPFFAMGSGYSLEFALENPEVALKLVGANSLGSLGAVVAIGTDASNKGTYSLANIQLVMEVQYYSSEIFSNINEMLCDGIKLRVPRVRTQVNKLTSQSNNIQLSEHGRSINALVCGVRDTDKTGKFGFFHNDFVYKSSDDVKITQLQTSCGSETIPSNPIKYSSQSYLELERAVGQGREGYRLGNKINANTYYKDTGFGQLVSGDALFGVSFMSSPEMRDVMTGKVSSSGSIPLSLQLDLDGTSAKSELFSIVMSDSVVELLHDGSCIVSR